MIKIAICGRSHAGQSIATAYLTLFYGAQPYSFNVNNDDELLAKIKRENKDIAIIDGINDSFKYARLKAEGYIIVKINASDDVITKRMYLSGDDSVSKQSVRMLIDNINADYCVDNNSDTDFLYDELDAIMFDLGVEKAVRGE